MFKFRRDGRLLELGLLLQREPVLRKGDVGGAQGGREAARRGDKRAPAEDLLRAGFSILMMQFVFMDILSSCTSAAHPMIRPWCR